MATGRLVPDSYIQGVLVGGLVVLLAIATMIWLVVLVGDAATRVIQRRNLANMKPEKDMDEPVNIDTDFDDALDALLGTEADDDSDDEQ